MNVRITPRVAPFRTDLYGGVRYAFSTGEVLYLGHLPVVEITADGHERLTVTALAMGAIAEIALDDEPGDWW